MAENDVPNINFKGFMIDIIQANWNVTRMIYEDGDQNLPMVTRKRTCISIGLQALIRYIKPSL